MDVFVQNLASRSDSVFLSVLFAFAMWKIVTRFTDFIEKNIKESNEIQKDLAVKMQSFTEASKDQSESSKKLMKTIDEQKKIMSAMYKRLLEFTKLIKKEEPKF